MPANAAIGIDLSYFRLSHYSSNFLFMAFLSWSCFVLSFEIFSVHKGSLRKLQTHDISDCSGCKLTKLSTLPFNQTIYVFSSPFDVIHSNVWGPSFVPTKGGS